MYLTTNKIINMKKFNHPVLGHFIAEQFERAHLSIEAMRKEIHICLLYTSPSPRDS